jgi:putative thioredoxin
MQQPGDFSIYGAVDLGARQAAAQRREQVASRAAQAAESGQSDASGGETSAYIIDVTEESFNDDVVMRSRTTPVVVDLWADWCQPCKQLSPVLEELATEANGAWTLAKIDVEANQQVGAFFFQQLQTQSIPLVVAIVDGRVVSAFPGAIPKAQIQEWLGQVLQAAEQLGVGAGAGAGSPAADAEEAVPPAYAAAHEAMQAGDLDTAASVLEKALAESPADTAAKSMLAQVNLIRRVDSYDQQAVQQAAAAAPGDVEAQSRLADLELATGEAEAAFDRMLGLISRTSGDERNAARLHLLDLFEIFGPEDPQVKKARTRLTALLF